MTLPSEFTLNTGAKIPTVLYGSYKSEGDSGIEAMKFAIDTAHYRGVDTALKYANHDEVRDALKAVKTPREKLFVQTKIWSDQMRDPEKWADQSIKELGTYIDVLLIHWPWPQKGGDSKDLDKDWDFIKTWKLMEKIPKEKVRSIGVSNFRVQDLKKLLAATDVVPVVNQCEFHPELPQNELVSFCLENKIIPQAYRPLLRGSVDNDVLNKIAKKHNSDAGQVALSWNVQRGVIVLPKSVTQSRIESNNKLIKLDDEDIRELDALGTKNNRTCPCDGIYGFDYFDGREVL